MKIIIKLLLYIVLLFATLDGMRDTFIYDSPVSYIKEVSVFVLFILLASNTYYKKIDVVGGYIIFCNIMIGFLLVTGFLTTKYAEITLTRGALSFGGWSVWVKLFSIYCLMNSLYLLRFNYADLYYSIPKIYIKFSMVYCFLTIFFIVTGLSSHLIQRNWSGRLSIGYPTMDSFVLVVAIIFTINFIRNKLARVLLLFCFFVVLMMQNTASGYIMLFMLFIYSSMFMKGAYKIIPLGLSLILCAMGFYIYNYLYVEMGDFGILLVDKINGFLLGSDTSSIILREQQIASLKNDMGSYFIYDLFGKGGSEAYIVENTYYALYGFLGMFGVVMFSMICCRFFIKIPHSFKRKTYYCHSLLISAVFFISCSGLIGFYLFPMIFIFCYLISIYSFDEYVHDYVMKDVR